MWSAWTAIALQRIEVSPVEQERAMLKARLAQLEAHDAKRKARLADAMNQQESV